MNRVITAVVRVAVIGWIATGCYLILCFVALLVMRRDIRRRSATPHRVERRGRPLPGGPGTAAWDGADDLWADFERTQR